jgi:hypothetical protein
MNALTFDDIAANRSLAITYFGGCLCHVQKSHGPPKSTSSGVAAQAKKKLKAKS